MLYCHIEVAADDTPAVDAVLKADTKRMALLEEVCMLTTAFNCSLIKAHCDCLHNNSVAALRTI